MIFVGFILPQEILQKSLERFFLDIGQNLGKLVLMCDVLSFVKVYPSLTIYI